MITVRLTERLMMIRSPCPWPRHAGAIWRMNWHVPWFQTAPRGKATWLWQRRHTNATKIILAEVDALFKQLLGKGVA